jgi:hypothetical protein
MFYIEFSSREMLNVNNFNKLNYKIKDVYGSWLRHVVQVTIPNGRERNNFWSSMIHIVRVESNIFRIPFVQGAIKKQQKRLQHRRSCIVTLHFNPCIMGWLFDWSGLRASTAGYQIQAF